MSYEHWIMVLRKYRKLLFFYAAKVNVLLCRHNVVNIPASKYFYYYCFFMQPKEMFYYVVDILAPKYIYYYCFIL